MSQSGGGSATSKTEIEKADHDLHVIKMETGNDKESDSVVKSEKPNTVSLCDEPQEKTAHITEMMPEQDTSTQSKLGIESIKQEGKETLESSTNQSEELPESEKDSDEYMYTKRDAFTSEIYKISITNLPKRFGFKELKKKLSNQLSLKPVKMKVWKDVCFITFRSEEEREEALKKINDYTWRGQTLKAAIAKPAADPFIRKRKQEQEGSSGCSSEKKAKEKEDDGLTPTERYKGGIIKQADSKAECTSRRILLYLRPALSDHLYSNVSRLKNSVTPLWKLSYEEQLKKKQEEMRGFFKKLYRQLDKNCPDIRAWLQDCKKKHGGIPCELLDIKPSPLTKGYRNKCEFTIGPGLDGQQSVVGFRFGQYSEGTVCVGSPEEVAFLPHTMKIVIKTFQKYLSTSEYEAFNPGNHKGYWRQLTIRTSGLDHVMAMVDFHPQSLTEEAINAEILSLKQFFVEGEGKDCGITSCFFRNHSERVTGGPLDVPYKLVFGDEHITESLLGMKFRISPNAFFQVNTAAAEVLYSQVSDWCNHGPTTTILDVCCGTGTIGLTVAKSVEKVIGVEMCSEAIKDAEFNANLNGVSNVKYHCAKAEDVMKMITKSVWSSGDVVAIVDPPRGGLHSSVVVALRNCRSINRLVYVSCNANGAQNNFIDLVRPTSKRLKGPRFYPVKAIPVDLFPHTNHCELIILFEREKSETPNDDSD